MRFLPLLLAAATPCFAAGCSINHQAPASMQDDMSKDIFASLGGNQNGLSSPYVVGSSFSISVEPGDSQNTTGWKLTSSSSNVMAIGERNVPSSMQWTVVAKGVGSTTLSVVDASGKTIDSAVVQVQAPTSVQLCAQGLLISGESDDASAVSTIRVVSGGTATFLARYFNGTQELFGNNALSPSGVGVASAAAVTASYSVRDFLEVTATSTGTGTVSLGVGQLDVQVPVVAVDASAIAKVSTAAESESGANNGQTMYVFGRAFDAQGDDVFGASFAWSVDGKPLAPATDAANGPTDLVTYQYDPSKSETIGDSLDGFSGSTQAHGGIATTTTSTTENVGCSVARGVGAGEGFAWGAAFVVGVGVVVARRRRAGS
jgi:hypothetical protein